MKNRLRFLSFVAFLLLLVCLFSLPVLAGQTYPVWIGSKQISTSNLTDVLHDGTVSYTPASMTSPAILHLKNAHLTESTETEVQFIDGHQVYFHELNSYIRAKEDLIIDLTGNNQIGPTSITKASLEGAVNYGIRTSDYGSYFYSVRLQGAGNLTICEKYTGILAKSIVIDMSGKLRIEEFGDPGLACCLKTVTSAATMDYGTTFLKNGDITLHSFRSNGVYGNLQISGGTIQAYAEDERNFDNLAFDHIPTYANGYKPYIYLGKTPGTSKYAASPSASDILNANYAFITFVPPAKKSLGTIKLTPSKITYNGNVQKPSVSVYDAESNLLKKNKDYTVAFKSESKKTGKYSVVITGIGEYTGIKSKTYTIIPKPVQTIACRRQSTKINVSWKYTASQCSGYQIQYATNKNFNQAKSKTVKSATTKKITLSSLNKSKNYYIRIRAYKTVSGKKIYSNWSKTVKK